MRRLGRRRIAAGRFDRTGGILPRPDTGVYMHNDSHDFRDDRLALGREGERLAFAFLRRAGIAIIARNYVTPIGEIDIVALDGETLIIVEVRTLRSDETTSPEQSIREPKRRRLQRLAHFFQEQTGSTELNVRFDVIGVVARPGEPPVVQHWVNAFT